MLPCNILAASLQLFGQFLFPEMHLGVVSAAFVQSLSNFCFRACLVFEVDALQARQPALFVAMRPPWGELLAASLQLFRHFWLQNMHLGIMFAASLQFFENFLLPKVVHFLRLTRSQRVNLHFSLSYGLLAASLPPPCSFLDSF